ncbi:copper chaperone CopZ [Salinibacillus xinjiangensis]|uniref:Copper chaperone CopZ n=1 Tax=Salinibacillus xinjiangensis TaxID=1229268 RepID=A0A6G1X2C9_9BACI|nr:copper chaperone CopZ [Salinibacillus xinjiangensis]MRG85143.1 copper chaperone CopZ [Salinibacillus xinjiangensis]
MSITLNVQGMSCGHCESAVKGALGELEGVNGVDVDLGSGKVEVQYEEGKVTEAQMKEAIEEQGYDVA